MNQRKAAKNWQGREKETEKKMKYEELATRSPTTSRVSPRGGRAIENAGMRERGHESAPSETDLGA